MGQYSTSCIEILLEFAPRTGFFFFFKMIYCEKIFYKIKL